MHLPTMSSLELLSSQPLHSKSMISFSVNQTLAYHRLPPVEGTGGNSGQSQSGPICSEKDCASSCLAWEIDQGQSGEHGVTT